MPVSFIVEKVKPFWRAKPNSVFAKISGYWQWWTFSLLWFYREVMMCSWGSLSENWNACQNDYFVSIIILSSSDGPSEIFTLYDSVLLIWMLDWSAITLAYSDVFSGEDHAKINYLKLSCMMILSWQLYEHYNDIFVCHCLNCCIVGSRCPNDNCSIDDDQEKSKNNEDYDC